MTREYEKIKEVARELDRAAARANMVGAAAATSKQCWFLAKLLVKNGVDPIDEVGEGPLTKKKASYLIDLYVN